MLKSSRSRALDTTDRQMLEILQREGRISASELGKRVNLSVAATHVRMRRLESDGYIKGYMAVVNRERIGYDLLCFIHVSFRLHQPEEMMRFLDEIRRMPEVIECHKVTGEHDCILKVVVKNHHDYERFWNEALTRIPGVARTHTAIVVNEIKSNSPTPIDHGAASDTG